MNDEELLERLAEAEHEQWMYWSKATVTEVSAECRARWSRWWIPYAELPEEEKEKDRVWARRALAAIRATK
jgi:hypothetical protein